MAAPFSPLPRSRGSPTTHRHSVLHMHHRCPSPMTTPRPIQSARDHPSVRSRSSALTILCPGRHRQLLLLADWLLTIYSQPWPATTTFGVRSSTSPSYPSSKVTPRSWQQLSLLLVLMRLRMRRCAWSCALRHRLLGVAAHQGQHRHPLVDASLRVCCGGAGYQLCAWAMVQIMLLQLRPLHAPRPRVACAHAPTRMHNTCSACTIMAMTV